MLSAEVHGKVSRGIQMSGAEALGTIPGKHASKFCCMPGLRERRNGKM